MSVEKLQPTRVGYLRGIPASTQPARVVVGPGKAIANKLLQPGLVERSTIPGHYRRTPAGDAAIQAFDDALPLSTLDILHRVNSGEKLNYERGVTTLVKADLLRIGISSGKFSLTEAGHALVARRPRKD